MQQIRYDDEGHGFLCASEVNGIVRLQTVPLSHGMNFTNSWGISKNTRLALRNLLDEMSKDNKESPQENVNRDNDPRSQSRYGDIGSAELMVIFSGDMDIMTIDRKNRPAKTNHAVFFKPSEQGWGSKYTYHSALAIVLAMEKDNKEHPDSHLWSGQRADRFYIKDITDRWIMENDFSGPLDDFDKWLRLTKRDYSKIFWK